ncbi:hypothetical protein DIPPA_22728 [Diplonema papillatum]|nr:hypothetical protein DIPPA_22728 [Diplonema papillatum]
MDTDKENYTPMRIAPKPPLQRQSFQPGTPTSALTPRMNTLDPENYAISRNYMISRQFTSEVRDEERGAHNTAVKKNKEDHFLKGFIPCLQSPTLSATLFP